MVWFLRRSMIFCEKPVFTFPDHALMQVERPEQNADMPIAPHRQQQMRKRRARGRFAPMMIQGRLTRLDGGAAPGERIFEQPPQVDFIGELAFQRVFSGFAEILADEIEAKPFRLGEDVDQQQLVGEIRERRGFTSSQNGMLFSPRFNPSQ